MLKTLAQQLVGDGKKFASIPCGLMRDLLSLDYSSVKNMTLHGIDIDMEAIEESRKLARKLNVCNITYSQEDAWALNYKNEFNLITSVGLNSYESDTEKVIDLYRNIYRALKPNGVLLTGVLTWPPYLNEKLSDWNLKLISPYDLHLESILHRDVLNIKWFNFRTLAEAKDDFYKAGFTQVEIKIDSRSIFPTIIATK